MFGTNLFLPNLDFSWYLMLQWLPLEPNHFLKKGFKLEIPQILRFFTSSPFATRVVSCSLIITMLQDEKIGIFQKFALQTVWKYQKFAITIFMQIFRETN